MTAVIRSKWSIHLRRSDLEISISKICFKQRNETQDRQKAYLCPPTSIIWKAKPSKVNCASYNFRVRKEKTAVLVAYIDTRGADAHAQNVLLGWSIRSGDEPVNLLKEAAEALGGARVTEKHRYVLFC